ncbi:hypothetical protein GCM10022200_01360 [Microbacterium awajiense]|uniref:Lipoprotein n=1 Tax=Microbacterium awajiense TaxID=415214 RepID=A0ABP7A0Z2_9MICO
MMPQRLPTTATVARRGRRAWGAGLALALVAGLAACSSSADTEPAGGEPTSVTDAGTEGAEASDDGAVTTGAGAYTSDDVGNATLFVDGVEFPDFTGDCEISRQNGKEDVGDLNEGDIVLVVGIDNIAAHEDSAMNYVALNEETFTFRDLAGAAGVGGSSADGIIDTLTELGPRSADGSRDIVLVRLAGFLDDGTAVDADVVCELQNAF